jgi:hypothetical protein
MGQFYCAVADNQSTDDARRTQVLLAKPYFIEAYRIESKLYGPNHPQTIASKFKLSALLTQL